MTFNVSRKDKKATPSLTKLLNITAFLTDGNQTGLEIEEMQLLVFNQLI